MPIREALGNAESIGELQRGLGAAFGGRAQSASETRTLADRESTPTRATHPHPVYTTDLEDVAAGRAIESARLVGWRYLISEQEGAGRVAEVHWDESAGTHCFGGVTEGAFVDETLAALAELERREEIEQDDYELRVLRIPGLFVFAVWLRADVGEDIVVPLGPTFGSLESGNAIQAEELSRALCEPARTVLEFEAMPEP